MQPIRTPYGLAPEPPPEPMDLAARLHLALCGDLALLEQELSRLYVELDALRRRVAALERREPPIPEGWHGE
jgi:hypothetical protein